MRKMIGAAVRFTKRPYHEIVWGWGFGPLRETLGGMAETYTDGKGRVGLTADELMGGLAGD